MTGEKKTPSARQDIILYTEDRFEGAAIKYNDYLRSLTEEAERLGLITSAEVTSVKLSIMEGLRDIIGFWTDEESSSVMADTANRLLQSMIFNADCYLIGLGNHEEALREILSRSVVDLYYDGQRRMKRYICEAAGLIVKVKSSKLDIPNTYYSQTVNKAIHNALKNYDTRYGAHLSPSFEYPLAIPLNNLRGMHYLRGYLMSLQKENDFCSHFESRAVKKVYGLFCTKNHFPLAEPRVNLYLILLTNAMLGAYLCKEEDIILLTEDECEVIEDLLDGCTREEISEKLSSAAASFDYGDREYNIRAASTVIPGLTEAVINRTLKNFAVAEL